MHSHGGNPIFGIGDFDQIESWDQKLGGLDSFRGGETFGDWKFSCGMAEIL